MTASKSSQRREMKQRYSKDCLTQYSVLGPKYGIGVGTSGLWYLWWLRPSVTYRHLDGTGSQKKWWYSETGEEFY